MEEPSQLKPKGCKASRRISCAQNGQYSTPRNCLCSQRGSSGTDFMPLQVDYREQYAAAGRFPGGFTKREAQS